MVVKRLEALFTANATQAIGEVERLAGTVDTKTAAMSERFASFGKAVALASVVAAAAIGVFAVKQAQEQEIATARLAQAVKNSGQSWTEAQKHVEAFDASMRKLGFDDAEAETSLAKLIPVTKSVAEAQQLMALAAEVARGRHISLDAATQLLVKVQTGHVALLGRIGIATKVTTATQAELAAASLKVEQAQAALNETLKKHSAASLEARTASANLATAQEKLTTLQKDGDGATISSTEALAKLAKMYSGDASKYAETFSGKLEVVSAQAQEIAEKIGLWLIPKLEELGSALMVGIQWLEKHSEEAKILGIVIGTVLVAAVGAWIIQLGLAAAAAVASFATQLVSFGLWLVGYKLGLNEAGEASIAFGVEAGAGFAAALGPLAALLATLLIVKSLLPSMQEQQQDLVNQLNDQAAGLYPATVANHGWGGGFSPTLPGRASGGPVQPYATYRINENGTEWLTMGSKGGLITPTPNRGGGGDTNVFNVGGIVTEKAFIDLVHEGLLRKNRQSGSLAFT